MSELAKRLRKYSNTLAGNPTLEAIVNSRDLRLILDALDRRDDALRELCDTHDAVLGELPATMWERARAILDEDRDA